MGYIFIFLSVFANAAKGYCSKKISNVVRTINDALNINIVRNIVGVLIAGAMVLCKNHQNLFNMTLGEFAICLVSGVSMTIFLLSWTFAIKTDAYMLVSACASASFIVPCIAGFFVLNEKFTFFKLLSFAAIIAALYFLLKYDFAIKGKLTKKQILLLAMILIFQGVNQAMQKMYTSFIPDKSASVYTLYSFAFTAATLVIAKLFIKQDRKSAENDHIIKNNLVYIAIMSLSLFGTSYFQTLAAARIDAIVLYPITNALSLIAGSTMASLCFKEKLSKECVIGIIFVLCALICSKM